MGELHGDWFNLGATDNVFQKEVSRLSDEEYGRVLDTMVLPCTDIFVVNSFGDVLLAERSREPAKGEWWCMGGRMKRGMPMRTSARKVLGGELKLDIDESRFVVLDVDDVFCATRHQAPQENGVHAMCAVLYVVLTDDEGERVQPNDEYENWEWFQLAEVVNGKLRSAGDTLYEFHRRVVHYAKKLYSRQLLNQL